MQAAKIIAIAIFCSLIAAAQQATQSPSGSTEFRAEGTIVDAETGQPLENASLRIGRGPVCDVRPEGSVTTGADGSFRIALGTAGPYRACALRDGYVTDTELHLNRCSPCTTTVRLHGAATVSGRIVSADTKEPMAHVVVEAIRVIDSFSIATSVTAASVRSFPDGTFSLEQLVPGQYFFRFTPTNPEVLLVDDEHDLASRQFATQWWPGGDSPRKATPFTLMAGTKFSVPDIWIPEVARYRVSGTVEATICQPGDAYTVSIGQKHGASVSMLRSMLVRCGSEFAFAGLNPGSYEISLLPKDGGDAVAKEEAIVTDRNLQKDFPAVHSDER